jgi:hypothetical protein
MATLTDEERAICKFTNLSEEVFAKAKAEVFAQRGLPDDFTATSATIVARGAPQPLPLDVKPVTAPVTADVKAILRACGVSVEHYIAARKRDE